MVSFFFVVTPTFSELPEETGRALTALVARMTQLETDGVEELRALLAQHPDHPELLGHLAGAVAYRGNHEEAVAIYRRYLERVPGDVEARWRLADRFVNLGRLDEATALYNEVLVDRPGLMDAKLGLRYVEYLKRKGRDRGIFLGTQRAKPTDLQERNRALNEREFAAGLLHLNSLPHRLYLESTLKCNFACKMCSKGYEPYYAEDLHEDIYEKARRELLPTTTRISITGFGEPTLASNFQQLLDLSLANGSEVFFVTNASLLNFERIEQITSNPVEIIISIDGATKETFEKVRVNANFDLILEKLAMIRKMRDIAMSSFLSKFSIHFVALQMNIAELPGVVRLAHEYKIGHVGVLDYAFNDNTFDEQSLRFDPVRANRYLDEARAVAAQLGVTMSTPPRYEENPPPRPSDSAWAKLRRVGGRLFSEPNRFPGKCSSPWSEPYVHTDGRVTPCCTNYDFMGDMKKEPFAKLWNGWRYKLLRLRIHSTVPPIPCRRCFISWGINGGNPGNVMAKEGLFVKAFYWLEHRWLSALQRGRKLLGVRAPGETHVVTAKPNYLNGRPMKGSAGGASAPQQEAGAR